MGQVLQAVLSQGKEHLRVKRDGRGVGEELMDVWWFAEVDGLRKF